MDVKHLQVLDRAPVQTQRVRRSYRPKDGEIQQFAKDSSLGLVAGKYSISPSARQTISVRQAQMLDLHQRRRATQTAADREMIQRQIDATDAQIDALVASRELYGVTEEERRVVEG